MIVPVPGCPGSGWYPGLVRTTTMWTISPEIVDPDWVTWLATITPINEGTVDGGLELLPVSAVQVWPQVGVELPFSKPLKLAGAEPLLRGLAFHHCAPHHSTEAPEWFSRSPMTKEPPDANVRVHVTVTVFDVIVPAGLVTDACNWSVPGRVLEYVKVAWPLLSVTPAPVRPVFGPEVTWKFTVTPESG